MLTSQNTALFSFRMYHYSMMISRSLVSVHFVLRSLTGLCMW